MGQQFPSRQWRSADQKLWLSTLVDAMEKVSREKLPRRAVPCDRQVLAALTAQLARPASPYPQGGSRFSLRN